MWTGLTLISVFSTNGSESFDFPNFWMLKDATFMMPVNHEMKETKLEVYYDTFNFRIEMQTYVESHSGHAYCIHDVYTFMNDFIMQLSTYKVKHNLHSFLRKLLLSPESFESNYKWKNVF